ncbi:hypothetical protein, partial [Pectobacterium brasiliense]|uniref:hypothetical protein n=1 Tax=Pectobacterium brasiliense TaxID=180957 RepID=UPI0019D38D3E
HEITERVKEIKEILNIDTKLGNVKYPNGKLFMMRKHNERIEILVTNYSKNYPMENDLKIIEHFINEISKILNVYFEIQYSASSLTTNKIIKLSKELKMHWHDSTWCQSNPSEAYQSIPIIDGICDLDNDYKEYKHNLDHGYTSL